MKSGELHLINLETSDVRKRVCNAAKNGRLEEIIELSSEFNDVKVLNLTLIKSCSNGHLNVVKWLVEHAAADVNYNNIEICSFSPLTSACYSDHLDIVKYLVETRCANVNLPDSFGDSSLIWACREVKMSMLMYLLCEVSGLDVNIADSDGNTALHLAIWCSKEFNTQIHLACITDDVTEVLRLVYVSGNNINIQNNDGNTPLHLACTYGNFDLVETLMLAGADEIISNDEGQTSAQVAVSMKHKELLKFLDRDSLCQEMLERRKKLKLSQTLLTLKLMKKRRIRRSVRNFNGRYKLKRKSQPTVLYKHS